MKFKEYYNTIYVKLQSVNLPVTVTNKGSHVAKELADNLIQKYERGEICRLSNISELGCRYKKERYVIQVWTACGKTNS
jgi:hypothetical protein